MFGRMRPLTDRILKAFFSLNMQEQLLGQFADELKTEKLIPADSPGKGELQPGHPLSGVVGFLLHMSCKSHP